ncbi:hypothetical protein GCM10027347_59070 [Larkinella harenae]
MRNITQDMIDEFSGPTVAPALLGEFYFDSGFIGMWTGIGTLTWGDRQFLGGGNFIGISPVNETQDLQAKGITLSLNGIPSSLISLSLNERSRGRPFRLFLASVSSTRRVATEQEPGVVLTEDGGVVLLENQLIDSPYRIFSGLMDVIEFTDNGQTADIRMSVENALIIGQRAKVGRYTPEDQKKRFPGDKGLDFINQLQDKSIVW